MTLLDELCMFLRHETNNVLRDSLSHAVRGLSA